MGPSGLADASGHGADIGRGGVGPSGLDASRSGGVLNSVWRRFDGGVEKNICFWLDALNFWISKREASGATTICWEQCI